LYKYFKVSFYFWVYLFKGLLVYGLIPATSALFLTLHYLHNDKNNNEAEIKKNYKIYYNQFSNHKVASFLISFLLILILSISYYLYVFNSAITVMLLIVNCYTLALILITFTYTIYFLTTKEMSMKQSFIFGFVSVIKNLLRSLLILAIVLLDLYIAYFNLVLFVAVGPVVYGVSTQFILKKL